MWFPDVGKCVLPGRTHIDPFQCNFYCSLTHASITMMIDGCYTVTFLMIQIVLVAEYAATLSHGYTFSTSVLYHKHDLPGEVPDTSSVEFSVGYVNSVGECAYRCIAHSNTSSVPDGCVSFSLEYGHLPSMLCTLYNEQDIQQLVNKSNSEYFVLVS